MKYTLFNFETGRVLQWGECPNDEDGMQLTQPFHAVIEGEFPAGQYGWDGTQMLPNPGAWHTWNETTRSWDEDLASARASKNLAIEHERDRRIVDPIILYDGMRLDATERDIQNVTKKLTEANSRLSLGRPFPVEQLVWRCADNILHTFANTTAYKQWLEGFAIALGERGTSAYAWSWQKKDQVNAAVTLAQLMAVDLTSP